MAKPIFRRDCLFSLQIERRFLYSRCVDFLNKNLVPGPTNRSRTCSTERNTVNHHRASFTFFLVPSVVRLKMYRLGDGKQSISYILTGMTNVYLILTLKHLCLIRNRTTLKTLLFVLFVSTSSRM